MAKQRIEIDVDVPEGFEATGEFRCAVIGDFYIAWPGRAARWGMSSPSPAEVVILRKVEPVRESRWGWVCCVNTTLEQANSNRHLYSGPLVRADYEDGKIVSVALESAEGGGA